MIWKNWKKKWKVYMYKTFPFLLKNNWVLLILVITVFMLGVINGVYYFDQLNGSEDLNTTPGGVIPLLVNNLVACFLISSGFFTFGLTSIIYLFTNGMILGESIVNKSDYSTIEILLLILPHGVFEIPALLLSGVIGFKSISFLIQYFTNKKVDTFIKSYFLNIALLSLIVILLVIVGGVIETYLTPLFDVERI